MRIETDSLGSLSLDDHHYYGIQTQRALENFGVSGRKISDIPEYINCILLIKKAAAVANARSGQITQEQAQAICKAADEFIEAEKARHFPLDVYQGGGGTSTNMNANEVLANRANECLTGKKGYDAVHPNSHVNLGQSTNDVIPSAMKMCAIHMIDQLVAAIDGFLTLLGEKEKQFNAVVKIGRTCLQDALPLTLGQQFSGYRCGFERSKRQLLQVRAQCLELPLGATAIGTEYGTSASYKTDVYDVLSELSGIRFQPEHNFFDALQNADFWLVASAALKTCANLLHKMASDLRLMSSGPRAGLSEISLPAVQPGSSIMPGKVNPVIPEMAMQIYFRVIGNDTSITRACEGELELNVWESLILHCFSESATLLSNGLPIFAERCLVGVSANCEVNSVNAHSSLALSTVLARHFDYQTASRIAETAREKNQSIQQAAVEAGLLSSDEAKRLLDPVTMTSPAHFHGRATKQ